MAIISEVEGLNVQVLVNGQPLVEYDDDEEVGDENNGIQKTTTKYIEAISDAEFTIRYTFDKTFVHKGNDIDVEVYMDGQYMEGHIRRSPELQSGCLATVTGHRYRQGNQWFERKFSFSKLSIGECGIPKIYPPANKSSVEDHTLKPTAEIVAKLQQTGVISVRIHRLVARHQSNGSHKDKHGNGIGQISEKALKGRALSHAVG